MKKLIFTNAGRIGLFSLGLLLVCGTNVFAQTVLSIDFSAAQGYAEGELLGQPAGGASVWEKEPGTTPNGFWVENDALTFDQHGGANSFIIYSFPVITSGIVTASWEWQFLGPEDSTVDNGFCLSDSANFNIDNDGSAVDFNENTAMTRMTANSGIIDSVNSDGAGAGTYTATGVDYRDGRVIPMMQVIDLVNQTYDVYAEGVLVGDDFGFRRNPQNGLDTLVLWNSGATVNFGMVLDNIVISVDEGGTAVQNWSLFN